MLEKRPLAPTVTALQRAWLREIGVEKIGLWQRAAEGVVGSSHANETNPTNVANHGNVANHANAINPINVASYLQAVNQTNVTNKVLTADLAPLPVLIQTVAVADDMEALRAQVATCTACGLCKSRKQAVFGEGAQQAPWLVLGEAPGEQEDRQGLPFVGRSGQLLTAMLAAVGITRERDVFITNVIKCRPPGNRNPKPEEIAACRPYLMRQIALLNPARILVLGRFAAQTLLETDASISSLRGRVHQFKTEAGTVPVVASYHPAYLLRSPSEKARSWQDLRLAAQLWDGKGARSI